MIRDLIFRNRQRVCAVDVRRLRQLTETLLREWIGWETWELGINLVTAPAITRLNEHFLRHAGPTDVIAFDYSDTAGKGRPPGLPFYGELFISLDAAVAQARRFRTTWQSELVRYVIHGLLHLDGHQDYESRARRRMKQAEDRLLRAAARRFDLAKIARRGGRAGAGQSAL